MTASGYAQAATALLAAARRAHDRGDATEREQLLDDADRQLLLMVDAMPLEWRRG